MLRFALSPALIAAGLIAVAPLASTTASAAEGLFNTLDGNWSGSGTITMADGKSERMRCTVRYDVNSGGAGLKQDLSCASDSYKFDLASTVNSQSDGLSGYWTEKNRNINGKVSGKASAEEIAALVQANGFIAQLNIKTRGDKQTVFIKSPSTDIRDISMSLSRR